MARSVSRALYRSLHRSIRRLERAMALRRLPMADEVFRYPIPVVADTALESLRAYSQYTDEDDIKFAQDTGFAALQSMNVRCQYLEGTQYRPRDPRLQFEVGTVFRHRKFGYRAVIVGHDPECRASDRWKVQNLVANPDQPFYASLVDERDRERGFRSTYVAQENIEVIEEPVLRKDLDEYFLGFQPLSGRYLPAAWLLSQYPDL